MRWPTSKRTAALHGPPAGHRGARGAAPARRARPAAHARELLRRGPHRDRGDGAGATRSCSSFEDIHWADEGMLDLIEHLGQWVRGPLLLLCLARDELLERRPGWGGGRRGATSIFLEPLTAQETRELIASLHAGRRARLRRSSRRWPSAPGGNPFFAEEMVRLLVGGGRQRRQRAAGHRAGAARRAARLARPRSSAASFSTPRWWGAPSGRSALAAVADEEGRDLDPGAQRAPGEGHLRAGRGQRAGRRARATRSSTC